MRRRDFRHLKKEIPVLSKHSGCEPISKEPTYKTKLLNIENRVKNMEVISSHNYIYLNLFLYCGELIFSPIYNSKEDVLYPFQDIHLIIQNHPAFFREHEVNKVILKRAMFLLEPSYGRGSLNGLWKAYIDDVPSSIRMYDVLMDEQGVEWVRNNPASIYDIEKDKELFYEILYDDSILQLMPNDIPFATSNDKEIDINFSIKNYSGESNSNYTIKMNALYPDWMFKNEHHFIMTEHIQEASINKKGLQDINRIINLEATAKELTLMYEDNKWVNLYSALRIDKIDYRACNVFSNQFYLQSVTHILGRLGAGKSFTMKILAKNLTNCGKRLLILENDVAKSLVLMKELKEIGIKAAVFLGESEIERHQKNFESSNIQSYNNLFAFYEDNQDELAVLSNNNYTETILGQQFDNFKMPKNQIVQVNEEKRKMIAPDYSYNDAYKKYEMLVDADVWVGNYEAFLTTKAPYYVDRFERNFLLLGWLRSDLIMADEYDQAQLRIDNHHVQNIKLVTNTNNKNENFLDYMYSLLPEIQKSKVKGFLEAYTNGITTSQKLGYYLYSSIFSERIVSEDLKNKSFTKEKLFFEFVKSFIKEKFEQMDNFNNLKETLIETINTVNFSPSQTRIKSMLVNLRQYYTGQMFTEPISNKEKQEIRNKMIVEMLEELKHLYKFSYTKRAFSDGQYSKEVIIRLDLLLSFAMFDYHNRYLLNEYKTFMMFWDQENKEILKPNNPFIRPMREVYVPAPLLGDLVSYRFSEKEDQNGQLELHYYTGVGRDLLARLPETFEFIEQVEKPAVLFLSATSYNPGSSAYHTRINPQWLLSNTVQVEQKIELSYIPKKDEEDLFKPVIVSGLPTVQHKEKALRKLVKMFVEDGNFERDFQRMQEEYELLRCEETMDEYLTGKRRIIAAPVFSFEMAEILGGILEEETNYNVLIQFENHKFCKGVPIEYDPGRHVTKNDIEKIYEKDADILVFVANSVGRGINILQGSKSRNSLIGTMYFFIRPYPHPDDFNEILHQLHSSFGTFLIEADEQIDKDEPLYKYWNKVNGKLQGLYTKLINRRPYWNSLSEENKKVITLNILTLMYQTMGRGLRGNTDLRVYLVDASFAKKTAEAANNSMSSAEPNEEDYKDSLLGMMEHLLWNNNDFLMDIIFKPLKQALKGVVLKPKEELVSGNNHH